MCDKNIDRDYSPPEDEHFPGPTLEEMENIWSEMERLSPDQYPKHFSEDSL